MSLAFGARKGCGWIVALVLLVSLGLGGCGSKYVPRGIPSPPAPTKKAPPPSPKRGTYKPYTVMGQTYYPLDSAIGYSETGMASWYGPDFHGKKTANGERYDMYRLTAAHRILPMNTQVVVKNLDNGRSCTLRVNDRGPFVKNRIIDLSYKAADILGVVGPGTARVLVQSLPGERIQYTNAFYVQYGAFTVETNARKLKEELLARGFHGTRVVRGELDGLTWWRVQVGVFSSLRLAEENRLRLSGESPDCFVIAD